MALTQEQQQDDIQLLISSGFDISTSKSPQYRHRLAQALRKQQAAGIEKPSREELRGHARAKVELLPKQGHRLEQHTMTKPEARDLNIADLNLLFKRRKNKSNPEVLVVVHGLAKKYPGFTPTPDEPTQELTISVHLATSSLQKFLKSQPAGADLQVWANRLLPPNTTEWAEIQRVGIAYTEEKGRHGRGEEA